MAAATTASARALARPASGPLHYAERRRSRLSNASQQEAGQPRSPQSLGQSPAGSSASMIQEESSRTTQSASEPAEPEPQCTYNAERIIGNGTFGIVYSALIVETDEVVAIKKVFVDRRYRNQELQIWREMRHPNIVALKHAFYTSGDTHDELYLNMVMEFVPETVYCIMKRFAKEKTTMPRILVQLCTYQACRALAHLHASNVVHRDIKPQNLLVDRGTKYVLKLCDFGSAARLGQGRPALVAYICSRYYRAPELIFGTQNYTTALDLWSIGCVLAELIRGRPLFPGENGVDQLMEIVKVMGSPTRKEVLAMNPQYYNFAFPVISARGWGAVFRPGTVTEDVLSLLTKLLQYDPEIRHRPLEACSHRYFDELRDESTRLPDGQTLPSTLYELTNRELRICSQELKDRLIPSWSVNGHSDK